MKTYLVLKFYDALQKGEEEAPSVIEQNKEEEGKPARRMLRQAPAL